MLKKTRLATALCLFITQPARASIELYAACATTAAIITYVNADEDEKTAITIGNCLAAASLSGLAAYLFKTIITMPMPTLRRRVTVYRTNDWPSVKRTVTTRRIVPVF